jgi:hypothetical protein
MDLRDELNQERDRRKKAEEELAKWQIGAIQKLSPEEIAQTIQAQQMEALTYHLMKQKQAVDELTGRMKAKEKELESAVINIKNLEEQVEGFSREAKKAPEPEPKAEQSGQRFGISGIPTDEELESILHGSGAAATQRPQVAPGMERAKRSPKGVKDFVQLMRRMERIKLYDASLLLDMNQDDVLVWARALERRGYLQVVGLRDKTLLATDRILKTR